MNDAPAPPPPGIDPGELAIALKVLRELPSLPPDHPDIRTVKREASFMYKLIKKARRAEIREERQRHDQQIIERTATGSPMRIDDETAGIPLVSTAQGAFAGELITARGCYICKEDFTLVDAFYHWLCPRCATKSHAKRDQRTDLTGKRALLTGGRAKIGMYIALRLLRDGAHTTITTRFPRDAVRRFSSLEDSGDWLHRLKVVGIDLRDPTQVISLADDVAAAGPLDILVNNACQTVRRTPGAYAPLVEGESAPLPSDLVPGGMELPEMVTFDRISEAHPAVIAGALADVAVAHHEGESAEHALAVHNAATLTALSLSRQALKAGSASLEAHVAGTAVDAGGLLPDVQTNNSWTQTVGEVDPLELLEVQLCNSIAPFLLVSRLRPALAEAARRAPSKRAYVVNVSAMEGQFSRRYKGAGHPHTNMAKAALNMLTRTSAGEMFETDGILMTAVDTGWITDERPHQEKLRIAAEGWHAPLDLVDGAARVYDPIVRGEAGDDLFGCFVKDYEPSPW
ncbi:short-chain dehydrogenase [Nocardioides gansuensis]|uniref:Short-chain dehydrogenase n=1 Tax=Nocardioides gansuensis TaxID=2138300 RepID=A0A2T8FET1_9ACTN|nr:SDR family NAD(P)-dependent oxidoreductase [Nocardioides gansuensis]PVG84214.1 short-chain dehydrogenase [Nocardioides gansuensis]